MSKVKEYGEVVSVLAPLKMPSTLRSTSEMDTLSVAVAVTVVVPEMVEPSVGEVMAVVGGVVSGTLSVVKLIVGESPSFPALSKAIAMRV